MLCRGGYILFYTLIFANCSNNNSSAKEKEDSIYEDSIWKTQYRISPKNIEPAYMPSNYDYLIKYVAPLEERFAGKYTGSGSCFYYKEGAKRFIVSNRHIFTG